MPFSIGRNFHIIHMTDDLKALDAWYYDVFSCQRFMPDSYMPAEKRDASLVAIGELCIEPLAPAFRVEGWDQMPLGRFQQRFGSRFHSIAWYVDEGDDDLYAKVKAAGVRCFGTGGVKLGDTHEGAWFTHPRDTYTQLEFIATPKPGQPFLRDPRGREGWTPEWWADNHPLGLTKFSHATINVQDLAKAKEIYVDLLEGQLLHEGEVDHQQTTSAFVLVGSDMVVELAQPHEGSSAIGQDLAEHGQSLYAVTYQVKDLTVAEEHLTGKGVKLTHNDGTTLITDPDTSQGATMAFTTWAIPGDPRPSWSKG